MRDANRYDHNWYQNEMEQCENGDYVHYIDYATLRARLVEVEAQRDKTYTAAEKLCRTYYEIIEGLVGTEKTDELVSEALAKLEDHDEK